MGLYFDTSIIESHFLLIPFLFISYNISRWWEISSYPWKVERHTNYHPLCSQCFNFSGFDKLIFQWDDALVLLLGILFVRCSSNWEFGPIHLLHLVGEESAGKRIDKLDLPPGRKQTIKLRQKYIKEDSQSLPNLDFEFGILRWSQNQI